MSARVFPSTTGVLASYELALDDVESPDAGPRPDAALARRAWDLGRRLRDAEAAYAACASACGVEYAADSGPTAPGPVDAVVDAIREGRQAFGQLIEAQERLRDAEAERDRLRTQVEAPDEWADRETPEDAAIKAAHPLRSGRHDLYQEAMRLVGARHSKFALVALVTWLLLRAENPDPTTQPDRNV